MPELYELPIFSSSNLKAYYRFSSNANDSKNSYNLTNTNSVVLTNPGVFGNGADFGANNTNKYLSVANNMGITSGNISIGGWVHNNGTEVNTNKPCVITHGQTTTDVRYMLELSSTGYTFSRSGFGGGGTTGTVNYIGGHSAAFDFVVLTYDGTNVRGYVNGNLVGQAAASGNGNGYAGQFTGVMMGATNGWDGISTRSNASIYSSLSGKIDDCFVYAGELTLAEIKTIYGAAQSLAPMFFSGGVTLG